MGFRLRGGVGWGGAGGRCSGWGQGLGQFWVCGFWVEFGSFGFRLLGGVSGVSAGGGILFIVWLRGFGRLWEGNASTE